MVWVGKKLCLYSAYDVDTDQTLRVDRKLYLWPLRGTLPLMLKSGRIPVHISFPTAKERDDAIRKAKARGPLSGQIQWYFLAIG